MRDQSTCYCWPQANARAHSCVHTSIVFHIRSASWAFKPTDCLASIRMYKRWTCARVADLEWTSILWFTYQNLIVVDRSADGYRKITGFDYRFILALLIVMVVRTTDRASIGDNNRNRSVPGWLTQFKTVLIASRLSPHTHTYIAFNRCTLKRFITKLMFAIVCSTVRGWCQPHNTCVYVNRCCR